MLGPDRIRAAWRAAENAQGWLDYFARQGELDTPEPLPVTLAAADLQALIDVAAAACACGGAHHCAAELAPVAMAARELINEHHLGDFVYIVRERLDDPAYEGNTWEHPKVVSFARAVETLREFAEGAERPPALSFDNAPGAPMTRERADAALALFRQNNPAPDEVAPARVDMSGSAPVAWYRPGPGGGCTVCGSRPGADTTWRRTPEEWQHACPALNPQVGHLPMPAEPELPLCTCGHEPEEHEELTPPGVIIPGESPAVRAERLLRACTVAGCPCRRYARAPEPA